MKKILGAIILAVICYRIMAQSSEPKPAATPAKLASTVFEWEKMKVETTTNGVRRAVFDAPTATLDKVHCHITTLNPGETSGAPRRHLQEEIIIVKEGSIEATADGQTKTAGAGSVIFFASGATTFLHNPGKVPATYTVIYYFTPLTPKS